jgi:protein-S-isoprenylcysteine O-methyltransferase Ste14
MKRSLLNLFGLVLTWVIWLWLAGQELTPPISLAIAIGCTLALFLSLRRSLVVIVLTAERAEWALLVHYLFAIFFGSAILAAVRFGQASTTGQILFPAWLGLGLMAISGLVILLVVFNLAVKGLGAPFAVALTRLVVTDWLYAWTRNPMILSALAFLVGLGLWLQSGLFLVWVLVVVSPAILVFVKVYEERELEIRFGPEYLDYKAKTPMIWPRRPRR